MSRTIRNSWNWSRSQDWKSHADRGCGGKCWCKTFKKANPPARDQRRLDDEMLYM